MLSCHRVIGIICTVRRLCGSECVCTRTTECSEQGKAAAAVGVSELFSSLYSRVIRISPTLFSHIEFILSIARLANLLRHNTCTYIVAFRATVCKFNSESVTPRARLSRPFLRLVVDVHPSSRQNVFRHLIPRIHSRIMISLLATFSPFAIFHVTSRREMIPCRRL